MKNGKDDQQTFSKNLSDAPGCMENIGFAIKELKDFSSNHFDKNCTIYLKEGNYSASSNLDNAIFNLIA